MNRKLTAVLLIAAAVLTNAAFTVLGTRVQLPRRPQGTHRRDPRRASATTRARSSFWFAVMAVSAALFAPIAIGVGRLSTHRGDAARPSRSASPPPSSRSSACPAGRCWCPGSPPTPPAPTRPPQRAARDVLRDGAPGPRATSSARRSATCSPPPGPCWSWSRCTGRWPDAGSPSSAPGPRSSSSPGVLSPLDLPVIDTANFAGYVLWSVWLDRLRRPAAASARARRRPPRVAPALDRARG